MGIGKAAGGREKGGREREWVEEVGREEWRDDGGECNDAPRMNMHDKRDRVSLERD